MSTYENEEEILEELTILVKKFAAAEAALKAIDYDLSTQIAAARETGISWQRLQRASGMTMARLRQRALGPDAKLPPRKPAPTLEGHVGLTEAGRILNLTASRVGALARQAEVPFEVVDGKRLFPAQALMKMAEARRGLPSAQIDEPQVG